jgi:hypothetical protein
VQLEPRVQLEIKVHKAFKAFKVQQAQLVPTLWCQVQLVQLETEV